MKPNTYRKVTPKGNKIGKLKHNRPFKVNKFKRPTLKPYMSSRWIPITRWGRLAEIKGMIEQSNTGDKANAKQDNSDTMPPI